jgi:phosphoribosylanthranilate isomerase
MPVRVKICGITRLADALKAVEYGADALGFNFWPKSKRFCPPGRAARIIAELPPFVALVGVFVNASAAHIERVVKKTRIGWAQLHGDESPAFCRKLKLPWVKAIAIEGPESLARLREYSANAFLLDAPTRGYGGSGQTFDWRWLAGLRSPAPVLLAGGLDPTNVAEAVARVRPGGVDVASGVESAPGVKDARKMKQFIRAAKESGQ